ncbi:MAG: peroxidase-related enzyme [Gammaproteobacteria bacterium]|nr:peroxidase-related enzyme [Gammaproteobacteria bacterium]
MQDLSISRYDVPELDSLPEDVRDRILEVQEKAGFVPNVFATLAHRPDEFRAFFAYHDALMEREGSTLSAAEKEMIVVTTSAANGCEYCVVAHGALLRIFSKERLLADQIAVNHLHAPITPRQKAMLDFAMKVSRTPELVETSDYDALYEHDYTDEDIWDISGITAFFGLSNRMAIVSGMRANEAFYMMGRIPREKK